MFDLFERFIVQLCLCLIQNLDSTWSHYQVINTRYSAQEIKSLCSSSSSSSSNNEVINTCSQFQPEAYTCSELVQNFGLQDGLFNLTIPSKTDAIPQIYTTYCDSDGFTLFQRRGQFGNPVNFFTKNYSDFQKGIS